MNTNGRPGSRDPNEIWSLYDITKTVRNIKRIKHPCVVYLTELGEVSSLPSSHASSIKESCIVGVYDKKVTAEMIYEDLRAL